MQSSLKIFFHLCLILLPFFLAACGKQDQNEQERPGATPSTVSRRPAAADPTSTPTPEQTMKNDASQPPSGAQGASHRDEEMVSLGVLDPTFIIDNPLASDSANAFHYRFFSASDAYLRYGFAKKLIAAQQDFQQRGLRLKIWAAYRPFAVQVKMFELVGRNSDWVSDPYNDSGKKTHVRGAAVDVTLVDAQGNELAMPTPYLDFKAWHEKMKHGYMKLPKNVIENRELLNSVMLEHGLEAYAGEWWHYQDPEWASYPVIEKTEYPAIHRRILVDELLAMK